MIIKHHTTHYEEDWNAHCTCASSVPADRHKNSDNEDIQPAYKKKKRGGGLEEKMTDELFRRRTGHEYYECADDTLKPRRLRVYPDNQADCKQPGRFFSDQLFGQYQTLPDTKKKKTAS